MALDQGIFTASVHRADSVIVAMCVFESVCDVSKHPLPEVVVKCIPEIGLCVTKKMRSVFLKIIWIDPRPLPPMRVSPIYPLLEVVETYG